MLAEPAALLFLVAETLRDRKPFERFLEFAVMRGDDAGERGGELGPHRDFAPPFVGEVEKLADDLRAAFLGVKLRRLQDGPFPFDKAVRGSHFAPFREDVVSPRAIVWQKITETRERLHHKLW